MDDIGKRLKTVRKQVGISQRELAKRAGVTNSTISMIEKNSVSPSISSLKKVLSGIPMSLLEFFNTEEFESAETPVVYRKEDIREAAGDGEGIKWGLVGKFFPDRKITFLVEHYESGADTGDEAYSHEGEEVGYVVSGQIELSVDDQKYTLGPGEAFYFESKRPHRFRNPFEEPCQLVSATTGTNL
ncbi:cupin domain-containing protein [Reinekea forsetii]|nr:cupin domain-containing protein [Reinekea forsetii]